MGDTFKKVRDGEKLRIPARTYNAMIDAAQDYINRRNNINTDSKGLSDNVVYVKNETGSAVDSLKILGIGGVAMYPSAHQPVVFRGAVPLIENHSNGRFVITAEPIASNAIGRAYATGCVPVKVYIHDQTHSFADILDNDKTRLKSTVSGPTTILWKDSGTGEQWAMIRFGAAPDTGIRRAKLTTSAGSGNTVTANLYDSAGNEQTSGDESGATVYCNINNSGIANLYDCIPRLYSGQDITVVKLPCRVDNQTVYRWYCTTVFQAISTNFLGITPDGHLYVKLEQCVTS
jgi:hypothetical protein